jgi:predicted nucleotidyltransferase
MGMAESTIPARFAAAYSAVAALADAERYRGAFIFGSVARGTATAQSDCDVRVLIDQDSRCANINHPVIAGVKLDLTFISLAQLQRDTAQEIARATRLPMIAESIIVFDKTGALGALRDQAR